MSLSKTKPTKIYRQQCIKNVYGGEKKPRKLKIQEQSHDQIIKNIRNPFRLKKKKNEKIKDRMMRDISTLFDQEKDYHKPVRVCSFWNNKYVEYKINGDRNKTLPIKEYLDVIKPYIKDIINNIQKCDTWKI